MRCSTLCTLTGWRLLIPLAMTLAGCSGDTLAPAPETAMRLPVITIATTTQPREYAVAGNVVSDRRIEIASKISGYIQTIAVAEGDHVAAGDLLVQIDDSQVAAAITQARAALDTAQAALADAAADLARYEALLAQNSIAEAQVRKARLQRDAASGQLRAARAALEQASAQQQYTRITSPVDAVVIARQRRSGDLVAPGLPLLTLESPTGLLLETWVAEEWVGALAPGAPVNVTIDGIAAPLQGRLARIVPSGDPVSRRFAVKIALPETPGLAPGLFGRAHFKLGAETLLAVPRAALVERGGLTGVFVVDAEQRARFRWLRTRREWPDRVEVTAGIAPGERIIARAAPRLPEGTRIDPEVAPGE